jgi:protein gp37
MMSTKIEWADVTWNPVTGCTAVSEGCAHCYAERMAHRLAGRFGYPAQPHEFDVTLHEDRLEEPLHWRKARRVFVCSMSDLFHPDVPEDYIWRVIETCWKAKPHTFMILTKRSARMLDVLSKSMWWLNDTPDNIWLGVTVENQARADERIPILLEIPAPVHFVSIEPMLGPVTLQGGNVPEDPDGPWSEDEPSYDFAYLRGVSNDRRIDWVIAGGETGPGARLMKREWAESLLDQCQSAGVPFFYKGAGTARMKKSHPNYRKLNGREWNEIPTP